MKRTITTIAIKHILTTSSIMLSCFIVSCGPSAEQQAYYQKRHDDSLRYAVEAQTKREVTVKVKNETINNVNEVADKQKKLNEQTTLLSKLSTLLDQTNAKLAVIRENRKRDKDFHLGRLKSTRDQQIYNDEMNLQAYERQVQSIQQKITEVNQNIANLTDEISSHPL